MNPSFLKQTAVTVLLTFTLTQFQFPVRAGAEPLPAYPVTEIAAPSDFSLDLPSDLGKIESVTAGTEGRTLIHIQEPHGSYDAQKKIEGILHYLSSQYGFDLVLLEGTAFQLDRSLANFIPNEPAKNIKILEELAKRHFVSGAELFVAKNRCAQGYGIEDVNAYLENGRAFVEVLRAREKSEGFLRQLNEQIERISSHYLNSSLKGLIKRREQFDGRIISITERLDYLKDEAKEHLSLNLNDPASQFDWPMLVRILKLQQFEKEIDQEKLEAEKKEFLEDIRRGAIHGAQEGVINHAPTLYQQIERLLTQPLNQNSLPSPNTAQLFEQMVSKLPKDFDYAKYPNVNRFIGHLILQSEIKADGLYQEIQTLENKITNKLVRTEEEKKLVGLLKDYGLLKKLFALELTPEEYEQIRNTKSEIRNKSEIENSNSSLVSDFDIRTSNLSPSSITSRFQIFTTYTRTVHFDHIPDLDNLFAKSLEFYRLVQERDRYMLANIEKRMAETGKTKAVVITGGFHAGPFEEHFIHTTSYALITPKISETEGRESYINYVLQNFVDPQAPQKSTWREGLVALVPDSAAYGFPRNPFLTEAATVTHEFSRNQRSELRAPDWIKKARPYLDRLELKILQGGWELSPKLKGARGLIEQPADGIQLRSIWTRQAEVFASMISEWLDVPIQVDHRNRTFHFGPGKRIKGLGALAGPQERTVSPIDETGIKQLETLVKRILELPKDQHAKLRSEVRGDGFTPEQVEAIQRALREKQARENQAEFFKMVTQVPRWLDEGKFVEVGDALRDLKWLFNIRSFEWVAMMATIHSHKKAEQFFAYVQAEAELSEIAKRTQEEIPYKGGESAEERWGIAFTVLSELEKPEHQAVYQASGLTLPDLLLVNASMAEAPQTSPVPKPEVLQSIRHIKGVFREYGMDLDSQGNAFHVRDVLKVRNSGVASRSEVRMVLKNILPEKVVQTHHIRTGHAETPQDIAAILRTTWHEVVERYGERLDPITLRTKLDDVTGQKEPSDLLPTTFLGGFVTYVGGTPFYITRASEDMREDHPGYHKERLLVVNLKTWEIVSDALKIKIDSGENRDTPYLDVAGPFIGVRTNHVFRLYRLTESGIEKVSLKGASLLLGPDGDRSTIPLTDDYAIAVDRFEFLYGEGDLSIKLSVRSEVRSSSVQVGNEYIHGRDAKELAQKLRDRGYDSWANRRGEVSIHGSRGTFSANAGKEGDLRDALRNAGRPVNRSELRTELRKWESEAAEAEEFREKSSGRIHDLFVQFKTFLKNSAEIRVDWNDPWKENRPQTNAGKIRLITNEGSGYPIIWLEGMFGGIYIRDIQSFSVINKGQGVAARVSLLQPYAKALLSAVTAQAAGNQKKVTRILKALLGKDKGVLEFEKVEIRRSIQHAARLSKKRKTEKMQMLVSHLAGAIESRLSDESSRRSELRSGDISKLSPAELTNEIRRLEGYKKVIAEYHGLDETKERLGDDSGLPESAVAAWNETVDTLNRLLKEATRRESKLGLVPTARDAGPLIRRSELRALISKKFNEQEIASIATVVRLFTGNIIPEHVRNNQAVLNAVVAALAEEGIHIAQSQYERVLASLDESERAAVKTIYERVRNDKSVIAPIVELPRSPSPWMLDQIFETAGVLVGLNKAKAHRVILITNEADLDAVQTAREAYAVKHYPKIADRKVFNSRVKVADSTESLGLPADARTAYVEFEGEGVQANQKNKTVVHPRRLLDRNTTINFDDKNQGFAVSLLQAVLLLLYGEGQSGLKQHSQGDYRQISQSSFSHLAVALAAIKQLAKSA